MRSGLGHGGHKTRVGRYGREKRKSAGNEDLSVYIWALLIACPPPSLRGVGRLSPPIDNSAYVASRCPAPPPFPRIRRFPLLLVVEHSDSLTVIIIGDDVRAGLGASAYRIVHFKGTDTSSATRVVTAECSSNVSVAQYAPDRIRLSRSCSFPQYDRFPFSHPPRLCRLWEDTAPRSPSPVQNGIGPTAPQNVLACYDLPPPSTVPPPRLLRFYRHLLEITTCQAHCTGNTPRRPCRTLLLGPDLTALAQHVMDRMDHVPRASRRWGRSRSGTEKWWADAEGEGEPVPVPHPPYRPVGLPTSPAPVVRGGLRYNVAPAQDMSPNQQRCGMRR